MLLPDGGPALGDSRSGSGLVEPLTAALVRYAGLQRALEPHAGALLAAGVPDMRPAAMPARFEEALGSVAGSGDAARREVLGRVAALRGAVGEWCERLAASPARASLDHNDLHPWNILTSPNGAAAARYYDWGDSVVAHPFAAMLVPLGFAGRCLGEEPAGPGVRRVTAAYLEVFTDLAPRGELAETLEVACRVAKIARALTWERALRASREQGEPIDPGWSGAAFETLASVLEPSYAGAA
jgi:aminoglycoside phosphotransferase (APT) family kinase protein